MTTRDKSILNKNELESLCQFILNEAKKSGASQAEVRVGANKGFSVSAHDAEVETIEYNQDKGIDIVLYFGKRRGSASLSDLRVEAILDAIKAASHIAKFTDEDPDAGLAEKEELAFHYPALQLAYPWDISIEEAIRLACECERAAISEDKRIIRAEDVRVSTISVWEAYANSHGFMGTFPHTRHEISCVLVARDGEEMQRDYSYTVSDDASYLASPAEVAKQAVSRTVRRLGARQLSTMKVPVIYAAEEARTLLGHFIEAIRGSNIYRKNSFLVDHLNKAIFPAKFQIKENPFLSHGLGSSPFDDDGVATRENIFVEDGILRQFSLGVYSARKMKMRTTGNAGGVHNLSINTSNKDLTALLQTMGKGLLITEMMGQGLNLVTGDYSRGAAGFWVENGEIQYPVQEVTVAGTLQDIYRRMVEVGSDIDRRGNIHTGSILIEEMTVAGI